MTLSDDLAAYADKKFRRLDRHQPKLERVEVTLSREATREIQSHFECRANLIASGRLVLRGEEHAADPRVAIDTLVDRLEERLAEQHGFIETNRRPNAQGNLPPMPDDALVNPSTLDVVLSDFGVDDATIGHLKANGIFTLEQLKAAVDDGRLVARLGPGYREQAHDLERVVDKLRG
jgi:ribosomal subunit interface protein